MIDPSSLGKRLYALSGRATLADIPGLYINGGAPPFGSSYGGGPGGAGGDPNAMPQGLPMTLAALSGSGSGGAAPAAAPSAGPGAGGGAPVGGIGSSSFLGGPGATGGAFSFGRDQIEGRQDGLLGERMAENRRSGFADPTLSNILGALQNAMSIVGGVPGLLQTGAASLAEMATGQVPGSLGGLNVMSGYGTYPQDLLDALQRAVTPDQVSRAVAALNDYAATHGGQGNQQGGAFGNVANQAGQISGLGALNVTNPVAASIMAGMMNATGQNTGGFGSGGGGQAYGGGGQGAVDSHGQVRGGGTGSVNGGITAGGPR